MIKQYEKYKESKIEWIGNIPSIWQVGAVKHCFNFKVGFTPPTVNANFYDEDGHEWVTISDMDEKYVSNSKNRISQLAVDTYSKEIVPKGSLLYSFKLSVGKVAFAGKDIFTNEAILCILPHEELELSYYYYCLPTILIHNANHNIYGAKIFNQEVIKNSRLPIPPKAEQTQIARYLDHQTSIIDQLIQQKEKLIKLLKEKRQAVINEAVTKGLNPNANRKDSGIEWLGEVPEGWRIIKIGRTFSLISSGTTPNTGNESYYNAGDINWLNTGDLNDDFIKSTKKKVSKIALEELSTLKIFPIDSIVIALYGATIGKLGHLKIETTTNQACCVLSHSNDIENRYLFYLLLSAREFIISRAYGGGQPNISQDLIKQLYLPAPTKLEQLEIVNYLDDYCRMNNELTQKIYSQIEKLKEYRQSNISEAVTGKVDVRDWKPNKQQVA